MELSVIVPAYNVERYLHDCLESILKAIECASLTSQAEVIIIDDGSTDNTSFICDEYAKKYEIIRIIHQKNCGQSGARNVGMSCANGKIICFVDSDDEVLPEFFSRMLLPIQMQQADIVCCGMVNLDNGLPYLNSPKETKIYSEKETVLIALAKDGAQDFMMNKAYKRELLDGILFPEGKVFEDVFVQHLFLSRSKKTVFLNTSLYLYRFNNTGTTHSNKFKPNMIDFVEACRVQYEFALHNYSQYAQIAFAKYVNSVRVLAWYQYRNNNTHSRRKQIRDLGKLVKQNYAQTQDNPYISLLLQNELKKLKKGYMSWSLYCKKTEFIKNLHNHPRYQNLFAKLLGIPLDLPQNENQY